MATANEKLDLILKYLNVAYDESKENLRVYHNTNTDVLTPIFMEQEIKWKSMDEINIGISFGEDEYFILEMDLALEYLIAHEMITRTSVKEVNNHVVKFRINFEGKVLIESGGYEGQQKSLDAEKASNILFSQLAESNGNRLNYLTAVLAVGTCGLAISEGMKIYKENHEHFSLYLEILGIISLLILPTILYKRKSRK